MSPMLYGAIAGLGSGAILILFSHLAPRFGAGDYVKDIDRLRLFGRSYTRRESHVVGVLVHLGMSLFFGALFSFGVTQGVAARYGWQELGAYAVLMTIIVGGVIMPLEGHGLFGHREDAWFAIDLMVTNILWVLLYALILSILPVA
jgi:hypothetical protein